jgi:hypothetical protein
VASKKAVGAETARHGIAYLARGADGWSMQRLSKFRGKPEPELKCPACNGTGFPPVKQPQQPGRKIYPARCLQCGGKGRRKQAAG